MGDPKDHLPTPVAARLPTPVAETAAYLVLADAAEDVAGQLRESVAAGAGEVRVELLQIASQVRAWTPNESPDAQGRRETVDRLRALVDRAMTVLHPG
jgi:hypothetical protein